MLELRAQPVAHRHREHEVVLEVAVLAVAARALARHGRLGHGERVRQLVVDKLVACHLLLKLGSGLAPPGTRRAEWIGANQVIRVRQRFHLQRVPQHPGIVHLMLMIRPPTVYSAILILFFFGRKKL